MIARREWMKLIGGVVRRMRSRMSRWPWAFVVGLLIVGGAWVFVELADDVTEGDTRQFDAFVLRLVRETDIATGEVRPVGPGWLVTASMDITALGSTSVLILMVGLVVLYLALKRHHRMMWLVLVATLLGQGLNSGLKALFGRDRPEERFHLAEVSTASFPSGHAMMSAVTFLTLGVLLATVEKRKRMKAFILGSALALTGLVGLTRVYLGVHYATDVLAGWTAGLTWSLACWIAAEWLRRRGMIRSSAALGEEVETSSS